MATTIARLEAILSANTRDFDRSMEKSETRMQRAGKAAGVLGFALAGGLAIGVKHAISDASDLHEQINKTEVVFRQNGKSVVEWSKHLARSFGMSDRAALEFAGTFGNMLKPMGIAIPKVTTMSKKLVELAGDMASFNNASPEDTLHALQSGLANQVRPLRQYGVFLDQDRIKLEAVSLGLVKAEVDTAKVRVEQIKLNEAVQKAGEALAKHGKGSDEYAKASANVAYEESKVNKLLEGKVPKLNAAQKAQSAYSLIVKDTTDAHGDFERTSGGLANQQRILKAEFENVSAQLGTSLIPLMTKLMGVVIDVIGYFEKHTKQAKLLAIGLGILAGALIAATAAQVAMNFAVLANPYVAAGAAIVVFTALIIKFRKQIRDAVDNGVDWFNKHLYILLAIPIIGWGIAVIAELFRFRKQVGEVTAAVADLIQKLSQLTGKTISAVLAAIQKAAAGLRHELGTLWGVLGKIIDGFKWLIDNVKKIGGFFGAVGSAVGGAASRATGDANGIGSIRRGGTGPGARAGAGAGRRFNVGRQLWDEIGMGQRLGLAVTSGYRPGAITKHGTPSDHGYNPSRAVDMAGTTNAMAQMFNWLVGRSEIRQAFFDPMGSIFNGVRSSYREGGHSDHIHIAEYDKGGFLRPGWNLAYNGLGRPEPVGGDVVIPVSLGGEHVATIVFDMLRRKAKVFETRNGRPAFGGI